MNLAIDVDGVCADLMPVWLKHYNTEFSDDLTSEKITHWDIENFVKPECGKKIFSYLDVPTLYYEVEPIEGALAGIETLRKMGHRVIFATSADVHHGGRKYDWLVRWGFLNGDRQDMRDYMEVRDKSLINCDLLLDDHAGNLKNFNGSRWLFDCHHNQDVESIYFRVYGWKDAASRINY